MHFYCLLIAYLISSSSLHSSTSSSHAHHSDAFPYHTACQEHSYLTRTPSSFFLLLTRPRTLHCRSFFLLAFLLLSGDVELNPGPTSFTVCTLNIRSILHPLHSAAISDFIDSHSPDLFCFTETLINPLRPLLNLLTVLHLTTLCSVSLEPPPKACLLRLSGVALVFLSVSLSLSYPSHILNSLPSNRLL